MQIETASVQDAERILEIQKLAFYSEAILHNNFNIPPLRQDLKSLREDFAECTFYKVIAKGHIVAAVKVRLLGNDILMIGRLVVDPEYQRQGVGTKLVRFIESTYPEAKGFELFTAEKSRHNILFYNKLGYSVTKTFKEPEHEEILLVRMFKSA
jgi:ribosomal protein S18 acetylase RimI-like enzyme